MIGRLGELGIVTVTGRGPGAVIRLLENIAEAEHV